MSKRNENRPGYKKTKVGWIPKEWEIPLLDTIAMRETGHTPKRGLNSGMDLLNGSHLQHLAD
jgi:hypothetical protein